MSRVSSVTQSFQFVDQYLQETHTVFLTLSLGVWTGHCYQHEGSTTSAPVFVHMPARILPDVKVPLCSDEPPVWLRLHNDIMRVQTSPTQQSHLVLRVQIHAGGDLGKGGNSGSRVFFSCCVRVGVGPHCSEPGERGIEGGGEREGCL